MHDELMGMLEGERVQPLYVIAQDSPKKDDEGEDQTTTEENLQRFEQEYLAALNQKGKTAKGA